MADTSRLPPLSATLTAIFIDVADACDGRRLVERAWADLPDLRNSDPWSALGPQPRVPWAVLAMGKAAAPMLAGLSAAIAPDRIGPGLLVTSAPRAPAGLPATFTLAMGEHPIPGAGSLQAGNEARAFVRGLPPEVPLLVLLSGGASALACLPADGVAFADKRAATAALAAAGAPIGQLNVVRKHLSAIKGGRLGQSARGPVLVLCLSDVVGNDPGTIASGPWSPDPSRYADALAIMNEHLGGNRDDPAGDGPSIARAIDHLRQGHAGRFDETPKTAAALAHITHRILAGPEHVAGSAMRAIAARGMHAIMAEPNTVLEVHALADRYLAHAAGLIAAATFDRTVIAIGNGEPTIDLSTRAPAGPRGRGGRATHLALLVARGLHRLGAGGRVAPDIDVAFVAAGTDDRDGTSDAAGAAVDRTTWQRAIDAGLDPEGALEHFDSAGLLGGVSCLVRGPGTSNLLDLHLIAAQRRLARAG